MIRRLLPVGALVAVVVAALVIGGATPGKGPRSAAARTEAIAGDLRCPVCQGLSIADSHSPTADAIKEDIRRRVVAGESDAAIKRHYVDSYGEWILLKPEARSFRLEMRSKPRLPPCGLRWASTEHPPILCRNLTFKRSPCHLWRT